MIVQIRDCYIEIVQRKIRISCTGKVYIGGISGSRDLYKRYSLIKHRSTCNSRQDAREERGGGEGGTRWSMAGSLNFFTVYKRRGKSFRCFRGIGKFPRIIPRVILRI